ncbi:protein ENHANCED DISEASE RESISTANCE 4 isoform X1 [Ricinus communis]|uniref:protein ENHANCED DISEASE RESISTANCE 4 isoform X1 n=1 Tax=Ricinus communis TaxID=3988 RepID=UPI00201A84DA|nr:protein ENHANCED DISEASE RESISTANCE 4 isoform X1 [Ricinus communis]
MTDSTKVRLVRCPKCENLLPELADYSVYQCGGCGAVLRAKDKNPDTDTVSHKSDEAQLVGVATELQNSLEKGVVELSDTSEADNKSNAGSLSCDEKNSEKNDTDRCRNPSKVPSGKWIVENDADMNIDRDHVGNSVGRDYDNLNSEINRTCRPWRSGQMSGRERGERSEMEGFRRVMRAEVEGVRFSTSNYLDEGPSNYNLDSSYIYGQPLRKHDDLDGTSRAQYLEKDRAELLRKLDELKEQLSRSCDVADKPKEKVPLNGRMGQSDPYTGSASDTWFPGGSSMPDRASMQFFGADKHAGRPPYFHHLPDSFPYTNGHEMSMHNFHPSMHKSNHIPGFGDPFGLKTAPHQLSGQYPSHQYFSRHYFDINSDPFGPYTSNSNFHQPSCSCFHCYERHHGVSAPVPPTAFSNKRFPDVLNNPMLYQHENRGAFAPHVHNSRTTVPPPLDFRGAQSHARWPSDLNSEMGGFVRCRPRRVVLAGGGCCCQPMAGGAPFFSCFNCFEVLQVPKKVLLMGKNQQKIQCGACSTVIDFAVVNKKLVLSINTEVTQVPIEVDNSSTEMIKESTSYSHDHMSRMNTNFSSDDYDNSGYDFQIVDTDPIALLSGQGLNSMKHQEMNGFHTSSLSTSEDENSPDALIAPREIINSAQQPIKASLSPPPPGSPLQQHFDFSSNNNNAVNRFGKGNRSSRSDQEKVMTNNKATTRQNSMKDSSLATEIEVPFHEYSHTGVSQDSGDANREDNQLKVSKGGDSFFANIKKSFKDLSRSNQIDDRSRSNVSVNGHFIPDRLVKKAEKLAGPIHPGQYWYDSRGGFWGVIGGPCLGIIPPFIEEFNYPMPEDCAGGNTSVYVNGRELHQKDLELLSGRGLPADKDRSYIIEISGRVLDEDTGKELDSLGKLAPTVEKVKHGFGMKVQKPVA